MGFNDNSNKEASSNNNREANSNKGANNSSTSYNNSININHRSCSLNGNHHSQGKVFSKLFLPSAPGSSLLPWRYFIYLQYFHKKLFFLQLVRNVRSREEETDDDDSPFSHRCHRKTLVTDNSLIAQEHPLPAAVSKLFFIPISCPVVAPHKKILKHLFSSGHSPRVASQFFHPAGEKKDFFPLATIAILFCLSLYPLFCFVYHHTMTTVSYYRTGGSRQVISLSLLTLPCDCSLLSVRI